MRHSFCLPSLATCLVLLGAAQPLQAADTTAEKPPAAPVIERVHTERNADAASALERQLPEAEQVLLKSADESFLGLWLPANVSAPKGVVILLPGDAQSAAAPRAIGPLRQKLPDAGWHTLSLNLPDPQGSVPPPRPADATPPSPAEKKSEDAASAPVAPAEDPPELSAEQRQAHAERVLARIQAGIGYAQQQQPTSIVLLGAGSGAYWAARYLSEHGDAPVHNLLLVAARVPDGFSPPLVQLLPPLKLATGDFYYQDLPTEREAARQRLAASKRQAQPAYIQVAMKALPGDPATEQEQLFRRIKGWLALHLRSDQATPPATAAGTPTP
ncbi:alpha/beta hydrolase family protein [Pseudomonas sp. LS44]|uniref:alpha/beta hydrolase family protein n=1 Tax=Pseudomonas sp. LS44 TaxID=1357074 RepID=UPI00215AA5CA|nr:alpha/beta hydrolase family protein [Pseudomonas sp. LS44]UVE17383.1 alpha/beta hydrolase family protein [Pseudomonas sp. LS44]